MTSDEMFALRPQLEAEARRSKTAKRIAYMHSVHGRRESERCGDCRHLLIKEHVGRYFKCQLYGITSGPGTDWRKKWEACGLFSRAG